MTNTVVLDQASKTYTTGAGRFDALQPQSLTFDSGEFVALIGPSGSGKSTLLNLVAGLDTPTHGSVSLAGEQVAGMSETDLARFRGRRIGIVFQFFQLIPTLTVQENVMLAMDLVGSIHHRERGDRALALLDQVGIRRHADKLPAQLSGGEQQRVAIARALANDPAILVADEPTGNLDSENSERIWDLFSSFAGEGRLVIVATHERTGLERYSRLITLADGALVSDEQPGRQATCLTA